MSVTQYFLVRKVFTTFDYAFCPCFFTNTIEMHNFIDIKLLHLKHKSTNKDVLISTWKGDSWSFRLSIDWFNSKIHMRITADQRQCCNIEQKWKSWPRFGCDTPDKTRNMNLDIRHIFCVGSENPINEFIIVFICRSACTKNTNIFTGLLSTYQVYDW